MEPTTNDELPLPESNESKKETADELAGESTGELAGSQTSIYQNRKFVQVQFVDVSIKLPLVHPSILLKEIDYPHRELRIVTGVAEGVALGFAWRGVPTPRPLTHELFVDVLTRLGGQLEVVNITYARGSTYFADLIIVKDTQTHVISCRPSDALALALRQSIPVPIMVAEELFAL
ncbi:MAG: bifunctional nuclease family protein [Actinobacteria bacterium]|nr:bifunctional nuclease family protein [Actinomycetota bacterium]MCL6105672.1 bifunctional nuclease family protein [Actinomycetota bacterium]